MKLSLATLVALIVPRHPNITHAWVSVPTWKYLAAVIHKQSSLPHSFPFFFFPFLSSFNIVFLASIPKSILSRFHHPSTFAANTVASDHNTIKITRFLLTLNHHPKPNFQINVNFSHRNAFHQERPLHHGFRRCGFSPECVPR